MYLFNAASCNLEKSSSVCLTCVSSIQYAYEQVSTHPDYHFSRTLENLRKRHERYRRASGPIVNTLLFSLCPVTINTGFASFSGNVCFILKNIMVTLKNLTLRIYWYEKYQYIEKTISFFLGAIHEKHNFKYLKNPTVKACKIWCNDVYMYILYCDIFCGN